MVLSHFSLTYSEVKQACRLVAAIAQDLCAKSTTTTPLLDDNLLDVIAEMYPNIYIALPSSITIDDGGIATATRFCQFRDKEGNAISPSIFLIALLAVHQCLQPTWNHTGHDSEKAFQFQHYIIEHHPEHQGVMIDYIEAVRQAAQTQIIAHQDLLHLIANSDLYLTPPPSFIPYNLSPQILSSPAFVLNRHPECGLLYNLNLVMHILTGWIKQDFRNTILAREEAGAPQPIDATIGMHKYNWNHVLFAFIRAELIIAQRRGRGVTAGQFNDSLATIPAVKEWMTAPRTIKSNIEHVRDTTPGFPTEADERAIAITQALLARYGLVPSAPAVGPSSPVTTAICSAAPASVIKTHRETDGLTSVCRHDKALVVPRRNPAFVPTLELPVVKADPRKALVAGLAEATSGTELARSKKLSYLCTRQTAKRTARIAAALVAKRTAKRTADDTLAAKRTARTAEAILAARLARIGGTVRTGKAAITCIVVKDIS